MGRQTLFWPYPGPVGIPELATLGPKVGQMDHLEGFPTFGSGDRDPGNSQSGDRTPKLTHLRPHLSPIHEGGQHGHCEKMALHAQGIKGALKAPHTRTTGPTHGPGVQPHRASSKSFPRGPDPDIRSPDHQIDIPDSEIGTLDPTDSSPGYPKWVG